MTSQLESMWGDTVPDVLVSPSGFLNIVAVRDKNESTHHALCDKRYACIAGQIVRCSPDDEVRKSSGAMTSFRALAQTSIGKEYRNLHSAAGPCV